jgi:hypothetical protein
MVGKPKYKIGDDVSFTLGNDIKQGEIYIVDKYGTFEDDSDASYDIFVKSDNVLYKHVKETMLN